MYFAEKDGCCPHLSLLDEVTIEAKKDILRQFNSLQPAAAAAGGSSSGGGGGRDLTTCSECEIVLPDLWICFTPGCTRVGCGRTKNRHALDHFYALKEGHPIVMKVHTLEMWCYLCRVWLGQSAADTEEPQQEDDLKDLTESSPLQMVKAASLEAEVVKEMARRLGMSREMEELNRRRKLERNFNLKRSGEFFLIPRSWSSRWYQFLVGDVDTVAPLSNHQLLLRATDQSLVPEMVPRLNVHYTVVMPETWAHFEQVYEAGPPVSESNPELRREILAELRQLHRHLEFNGE